MFLPQKTGYLFRFIHILLRTLEILGHKFLFRKLEYFLWLVHGNTHIPELRNHGHYLLYSPGDGLYNLAYLHLLQLLLEGILVTLDLVEVLVVEGVLGLAHELTERGVVKSHFTCSLHQLLHCIDLFKGGFGILLPLDLLGEAFKVIPCRFESVLLHGADKLLHEDIGVAHLGTRFLCILY